MNFNLLHILPLFLRGIVVPDRRWTARSARWLSDPVSVRFIRRLRQRYRSDRFFVRLFELGRNRLPRYEPVLLITGTEDIEAVLSDPDSYGSDTLSKVERLSLFEPEAVIISGGDQAWKRRAFNEAVLDTHRAVHHSAREFLEIVVQEAGEIARLERLRRPDFERMAQRITLQTVLGAGRIDDELSAMLAAMISQAGSLWFRRAKVFDGYYERLSTHLQDPATGGLLRLCRQSDSGGVPVTPQVTHWLFTMKDALETHVPRALAVIASHPDVEERVRAELADADIADPDAVDRLPLLEACVHEAIRLWTPVSLLLRSTTKPLNLNGAELPADTTVLIHAACDHRDPEKHGDSANQFNPDQWLSGTPHPPMNHFSNGPRICAGKPLALFLIKSIIAVLLKRHRFIPEHNPLETHGRLPYLLDPFALSFIRRPLPAVHRDG